MQRINLYLTFLKLSNAHVQLLSVLVLLSQHAVHQQGY